MRIQYLSDCHLDCRPFTLKAAKGADVCVFAGDFGSASGFVYHRIRQMFKDWTMPTIVVAGNHDYYGDTLGGQLELVNVLRDLGPNFHYLDNDVTCVAGAMFVGGTLWTDFSLYGEPEKAKIAAYRGVSDYRGIRKEVNGNHQGIMPDDVIPHHQACLKEIKRITDLAARTVVVTHFLPSPKAISPKYAKDPLNPYFCTDLESYMGKPLAWIFGHTHSHADFYVGNTHCVCNPRGYDDYENPQFKSTMTIEV